jgi:cysteine desulfurase/selenocysteine lyase
MWRIASSQQATELFEGARDKVRAFVCAVWRCVFVRGTTEAINLVAQSYGRPRFAAGDEILISWLEHHANIVPWQLLCEQTGARLKVAPITMAGEVDFDAFCALLSPRTKLVALAHVSNALGTVVPVERFIAAARARGVPVLLDGAQAVPHMPVDVRALDCDFYCSPATRCAAPPASACCMRARPRAREHAAVAGRRRHDPRRDLLERSASTTTCRQVLRPAPRILPARSARCAIDYLRGLAWHGLRRRNRTCWSTRRHGCRPFRAASSARGAQGGVVSFTVDGIHPHDLARFSITKAWLSHQSPLRDADHGFLQGARYGALPFVLPNTRDEVDLPVTALPRYRARGDARLMDLVTLSRRDRRSQPQPLQFSRRCRRRSQGGGFQSALRRSADAVRQDRGRSRRRRFV